MSLSNFIKENRQSIDNRIAEVLNRPENPIKTDQERRLWVLNDYLLYQWAQCNGVKI